MSSGRSDAQIWRYILRGLAVFALVFVVSRFLGRPQVFYAETFGAGVSDIVQCPQVFSTISGHFCVIQTDQGETPVPYAAAVAACNHEDGTEAEQAWIGVSVAVGLGVASLLRRRL
jgi:hypothetical protein